MMAETHPTTPKLIGSSLPIAVLALTLAAFCIGTSEFVIMGLLVDIADELQVSIARAGYLVTAYALGVVFGGPLLAVATFKFPRKKVLICLVAFFTFGNILCALSPNFITLLLSRIVTAASHGTFFGLATVAAVQLVDSHHRTQAVAWVFLGTTLANMLGVPIGTAEGFYFGWRSTFWTIAVLGIFSVVALIIWLPQNSGRETSNPWDEFKSLSKKSVQIPLLLSALLNGALFITYTFITPLLQTELHLTDNGITVVLLIIGLGLPIGTLLGGKLGDLALVKSLLILFPILTVILIVLHAVIHIEIPGIFTIFMWSTLTFTIAPMLQLLVVANADKAPNLASTFNQSAFNLGNAAGASLGSLLLTHHLNLDQLPLVSAGFLIIAWLFVWYYRHLVLKHLH